MSLNEFEIIEWIKKRAPLFDDSLGIGDDAAIIYSKSAKPLVVTTDSLVEGIHFTLESFTASDVGYKALAVNISDLAAMGAKPNQVLVSLGLPNDISFDWIKNFYSGFFELCQEYSITLVGGNITQSAKGFWVSITLLGEPVSKTSFKRDTAQVDDILCVSGPLGFSSLGLHCLQKGIREPNRYIQKQKRPRPRVDMAHFLSDKEDVHAMMDISDGLSSDLAQMLRASHKNAHIDLAGLMDADFIAACQYENVNPQDLILNGGEDYELLITVASKYFAELRSQAQSQKLDLIPIGTIVAGDGRLFLNRADGSLTEVLPMGFRHF